MIQELKKKMLFVGRVKIHNYLLGWEIFNVVKENPKSVIKSETFREYYTWTKFDIQNEDIWVTYDNCREMVFEIKDDKLFVDITTYTLGTFYDEKPKERKWSAKIELPMDFLTKITPYIDSAFEKFCEKSYEEHLDFLRNSWIKNFKKEILA